MLCAGAVRRKNVQNTMLKNLLDAVSPEWRVGIVVHDASSCPVASLLLTYAIVF